MPGPKQLRAWGYRVTSRAHNIAARVDRPDWKEVLEAEGLGHCDADWYRRCRSKDKTTFPPHWRTIIGASSNDPTGYVPKLTDRKSAMKLNVKSATRYSTSAQDIVPGDVFEFEGHHYMRFRLSCYGLKHEMPNPNMVAALNLKSGTMRLLSPDTRVVMAEEANCDIIMPER